MSDKFDTRVDTVDDHSVSAFLERHLSLIPERATVVNAKLFSDANWSQLSHDDLSSEIERALELNVSSFELNIEGSSSTSITWGLALSYYPTLYAEKYRLVVTYRIPVTELDQRV